MTDTATETQTTENEAPVFPDEMAKASFEVLSNLIKERNSKVSQINAAKGDQQTLMEELRESSDNPDAVAAREARDKAQEALDEAILALDKAVRPEVQEVMAKAGDTKEAEAKIKEYDEKVKPGANFFKKMYGEDLAKHLPPLSRLRGFSTKGAGSSGRRVRGYSVDLTVDDEKRSFDNLASAAKYLSLDTTQIQEKFFEAAGIGDGPLKNAPDRVDFTVEYTETDEDGNTESTVAHFVATRDVKDDSGNDETETETSEANAEQVAAL
jgi:hypothetical protein